MRQELIEEFNVLQEHRSSAQRCIQQHDVAHLKLAVEEMRAFLDRWQGTSDEPQINRKLAALRHKN